MDANGDELPITVQKAVRCRSIVNEVGLLRIIDSEWKVRIAKGWAQFRVLRDVSFGIFFCYLIITAKLRETVPSDGGLGACLEAELINTMRDMLMTCQSGLCINADCTETMNGTFVENPWTIAMYNAAKDACDIYHDQNMPWIDWAILIQGLLAMWYDGVFIKMTDLSGLLKRNDDSDPLLLTLQIDLLPLVHSSFVLF